MYKNKKRNSRKSAIPLNLTLLFNLSQTKCSGKDSNLRHTSFQFVALPFLVPEKKNPLTRLSYHYGNKCTKRIFKYQVFLPYFHVLQ